MSVAQEIVAESLPIATGGLGFNPAYLVAAGAAAAGAYNLKKITPSWHHTVNNGELGVRLRRGQPVVRKGVTEEQIAAGESMYEILQPNWYLVGLFRTIQTVYTTDQPADLRFPLESADEDREQVMVHAKISWHVSEEGDNPVHSITRVKHEKNDKKEVNDNASQRDNIDILSERVISVCAAGLGRVLSGKKADDLYAAHHKEADEIQDRTIEACKEALIYYGVMLRTVELLPITRIGEQILAQGLKDTRSPIDGAIAAARVLSDEEKAAVAAGKVVPLFPGDAA